MKTISAVLSINNNGINQSTTRKSYTNNAYGRTYRQDAGDVNRNASIAQAEYERSACEDELYRLRYGIENLLANNEQGDFKQRQRFGNLQNSFETMMNRKGGLKERKSESWMDRCCHCCRRWRKNRNGDNSYTPNEYIHRRAYNDFNDSPRPPESQLNSDSFVSTSPSPYIDPDMSGTSLSLRRSISNLINPNRPSRTDVSDLSTAKSTIDPAHNSLILNILEAKALDCLCTGYSKKNTQKQIARTLAEINRRTGGSVSTASFQSLTPNGNKSTSSIISPNNSEQRIKSSLKLNENIKSPRKNSKVTIVSGKTSKSRKSKKPPPRHRRKSRSRSKKSTSSTKNRGKPKVSNRSRSSSKLKKQTGPLKSSSRSRSSKTPQSSKHRKVKRKKTKPKSNNQIDDREVVRLQTTIYPQSYQEVYRHRQRLLKLLLSSTQHTVSYATN